tara:strand:- start:1220 stop:1495 length:276 start_codon:yes stop_codon:yes gene_type:complete
MFNNLETYRIRDIIGGDNEIHYKLITTSKDIHEYVSNALGYLMGRVLIRETQAINSWHFIKKNGLYVIDDDGIRYQLIDPDINSQSITCNL